MINIKSLIIFIVSFIVILGVLNFLIPSTGIDKWYNKKFIEWGEQFYDGWGQTHNGNVSFEKAPRTKLNKFFKHPFKTYDDQVQIKIINQEHIDEGIRKARRTGATAVNVDHAEFTMDTWQFAMLPLMLIIALILATPISIPRRLISMVLGLLLMNLFLAFRFWVRFVTEVNRHGWLGVGSLGDTGKWLITHLNTIFMFFGISMIVAVVIWIITTLRPKDAHLFWTPLEEVEA